MRRRVVMTTKNEQWCWREKNGETASGPFNSREEAIEEAKNSSDSCVVSVGRCTYPDPVHIAGAVTDMDDLLEKMEEYHYENEYSYDDQVFDLKSAVAKEAQESLKQAVREWAAKYLDQPTIWHTSENEEEVVIHPEAADGE
jgi:hypothetical protein